MLEKNGEETGLFSRLHERTQNSITVQWTYIREESKCNRISDWMPVDHFLLEYNSTHESKYKQVVLPPNERVYKIEGCPRATKHVITITSMDINGRAIVRAKPQVIETSAPIERPVLHLLHNEPSAATFEWSRPKEYGDALIKEYQLQVNGRNYAKIISAQTKFTYTDCRPLRTYTFRLKAISTVPGCDSDFSHILDITCPGALLMTLERAHCRSINKVKVAWNRPICQGGARVREYKLYFLKVAGANHRPTKDDIAKDENTILHTLSPTAVNDTLKVEANKYYWAFLEAEIVPDGCPNLATPPLQLHATKIPLAPDISIDIYGQKERQAYGKEIDYLVDKRDRLKTNINAMNSSVLAKGENVRDEELQRKRILLHRVEKRLREVMQTINEYTGTLCVVLKLSTPNFDVYSQPRGYRILVNNEICADDVPLRTKKYCIKLGVDEPFYDISVVTLSDHSVGHSKPSESVRVSTKEFRPMRFFCYFSSHDKRANWPEKGGCRLEETLEYERLYNDKPFPQRSFVTERVHAGSFHVMGVFDGLWQPLAKHFSNLKPTALLFWTKWCASSARAMEYYNSFAQTFGSEFQLLSCCVFSDEGMSKHQNKMVNFMADNNWNNDTGIGHFCACHPGPNSKLRKRDVENSAFAKSYRLLGVPTLVIIDTEGYIVWQGRVFAESAETFSSYLRHTLSVITKSDCPVKHCDYCDSEVYGLLYSEKEIATFTAKDLTIEHFNVMMARQAKETQATSLEKPVWKTTGEYKEGSDDEDDFANSARSIASSKSNSVRFVEDSSTTSTATGLTLSIEIRPGKSPSDSRSKTTSLRSSSNCSNVTNENATEVSNTKSPRQGSHLSRINPANQTLTYIQDERRTSAKSVAFEDERARTSRSISGNLPRSSKTEGKTPSGKRATSALPNVGKKREKISLPPRPYTSSSMYGSKQYDGIQSRYSRDNYVPYNPYRGKSYAKNGALISVYSKCGYIPTKPYPKDNCRRKVSRESNMEFLKQKVPTHREVKYVRSGHYWKNFHSRLTKEYTGSSLTGEGRG